MSLAGERHAARQRQDSHDGVEQRGLAGAVGADDGDDLVGAGLERHRAHRLDLAVGDMGIGDLAARSCDASEIGFDDLRIGLISAGRPSAILVPKSSTTIRSARPITKPMSCSTSSTDMPPSRKLAQQLRKPLLLHMPQSGRGLVQQQQHRVDAQRARDLQHALLPERQVAGELIALFASPTRSIGDPLRRTTALPRPARAGRCWRWRRHGRADARPSRRFPARSCRARD